MCAGMSDSVGEYDNYTVYAHASSLRAYNLYILIHIIMHMYTCMYIYVTSFRAYLSFKLSNNIAELQKNDNK